MYSHPSPLFRVRGIYPSPSSSCHDHKRSQSSQIRPTGGAKILPLAKLEVIFLLGLLGSHDTIILMIGSLCGKGV